MGASSSPNGFPTLDKYELLEEIGHGGMATVYRARDLRLDREVAVKVIHKHLRDNAEVRRRFVSEAKAVAKLRHPGIVDVYDVSDDADAERFLVVELVRGVTLRELLDEHGMLPAEVGVAIVLPLCEAVQHAHDAGVIHRDIKPENVLIERPFGTARPSGAGAAASAEPGAEGAGEASGGGRSAGAPAKMRVKLTDFGIAKVLDTKGVTSTGQILGSPAHMAPEQIEGGEVGPHTDVFALGVLLYETIVGHLPFEGKNPAQVLRRVLDGLYEPAEGERPQVGGRWSAILDRALQRDPALRLQTAAELGELLRAELRELGCDDQDALLTAFCADSEGFVDELGTRLVPRLLERGEAARREGRMHEAAADFNRALAFQPTNLTILRRVSALGTYGLWRRRTVRLLGIAAGALLLGVSAYGVTRWLRPAQAAGGHAASAPPSVAVGVSVPTGVATTQPTASATGNVPHVRVTDLGPIRGVHKVLPTATPTTVRKVRFSLIPQGALLTLDGQSLGSPFGRTLELQPGAHAVLVDLPPGSKCCKPLQTSVTIAPTPEDEPDAVQTVVLQLERRPSTVSLGGAPHDGRYSCPAIGLSGVAGSVANVTLPDVVWTGSCEFSPGPKRATVVLQAGEHNTIPWPPG